MKCLRCDNEMKHFELKPQINIYGATYQSSPFNPVINNNPHNIHSVYICDNCGYAELSTTYCDKPDI